MCLIIADGLPGEEQFRCAVAWNVHAIDKSLNILDVARFPNLIEEIGDVVGDIGCFQAVGNPQRLADQRIDFIANRGLKGRPFVFGEIEIGRINFAVQAHLHGFFAQQERVEGWNVGEHFDQAIIVLYIVALGRIVRVESAFVAQHRIAFWVAVEN